jgi:hypothetical protein
MHNVVVFEEFEDTLVLGVVLDDYFILLQVHRRHIDGSNYKRFLFKSKQGNSCTSIAIRN